MTGPASGALSAPARAALRAIALSAARAACRGETWDPADVPASGELVRPGGAFVTFKEGSRLRGCMGRMASDDPIWRTVAEVAVIALLEDPRFDPVRSEDLARLEMEITLVGPLRPIAGPAEVAVGADGLLVRSGKKSGVLLPQVAAEHGWSAERFLDETCRKAGLGSGAWRSGAELFAFGAEIV